MGKGKQRGISASPEFRNLHWVQCGTCLPDWPLCKFSVCVILGGPGEEEEFFWWYVPASISPKQRAEGCCAAWSQTTLVWTEVVTELLSLKKKKKPPKKSKGDLCIYIWPSWFGTDAEWKSNKTIRDTVFWVQSRCLFFLPFFLFFLNSKRGQSPFGQEWIQRYCLLVIWPFLLSVDYLPG